MKKIAGLGIIVLIFISCIAPRSADTAAYPEKETGDTRSVPADTEPVYEKSALEYYQDGVAFVKEGNYPAAEASLILARKIEPENTSIAIYLGWLYIQHLKDPEKALVHLDYVRQADPDNKYLWSNLARTYRALGMWENAAEAYLNAVADRPDDAAGVELYLFEAGRMQYLGGSIDEGISLMRDIWKSRPEKNLDYYRSGYSEILYNEARLDLYDGNYQNSLKHFLLLEEFIELSEPDTAFMLQKFPSYFYAIDYKDVIAYLENPVSPETQVEISVLSVIPESLNEFPEKLDEIAIARRLFSLLLDYLSKGSLKFRFNDVFINSLDYELVTHKSLTQNEDWGELDVVSAADTGKTLIPLLNREGIRISDYDTVFVYFDGSMYKAPRPSASVLHHRDFDTLFGARETVGFITIPLSSYHSSEGVYIHEYFHLLENLYGITPRHGFSPNHHYKENKRQFFPDWHGEGQFPYFMYHFINTIEPEGYEKVLHS